MQAQRAKGDEQSADDSDLGQPIQRELRYTTAITNAVSIATGVVVLAALILIGVLWWTDSLSWPVGGLIAALIVLAIAAAVFSQIIFWGKLQACERGVVIRDYSGNERTFRYDDVETIHLTASPIFWPADMLAGARLVFTDGEELPLEKLERDEYVFRPVLLEKIAAGIGARLLRQIQKGETIQLGDVRVGAKVIEGEGKIAWGAIDHAAFRKEGLKLVPKDPAQGAVLLPLKTPNLPALLYILWEVQRRSDDSLALGEEEIASLMYAFVPQGGMSRLRESDAPEGGKRRKLPAVRGYPKQDPELGEIRVGLGKQTLLVLLGWIGLGVCAVAELVILALVIAETLPWPWLLVPVLPAVVALGNIVGTFRKGFAVYERGMRHGRETIRWDECRRIAMKITDEYMQGGKYLGRRNELWIAFPNGTVHIPLTGKETEAICYRVLEAALPTMIRRAYDEVMKWGGEVTVKGLTLTRGLLLLDGAEHPFAAVKKHQIQAGDFSVSLRGKAKTEFSCGEWNFPVFYPLFLLCLQRAHKGEAVG